MAPSDSAAWFTPFRLPTKRGAARGGSANVKAGRAAVKFYIQNSANTIFVIINLKNSQASPLGQLLL